MAAVADPVSVVRAAAAARAPARRRKSCAMDERYPPQPGTCAGNDKPVPGCRCGACCSPAPGPAVPPKTVRAPLRLSGRPCSGRARLVTRPGGPLGYLAGRTPLLALSLKACRFTVGDVGCRPTPPVEA